MSQMSLLERLIQEDFGFRYQYGRYVKSEIHDSLVYDRELDKFYWNSRGIYGGLLEYLRDVRGYSKNKIEKFLREQTKDIEFSGYSDINSEVPDIRIVDILHDSLTRDGDLSYFTKRGLNLISIKSYKLGKLRRGKFYTVPIINSGILENIQVRTDKFEEGPLKGRKIVYKMYRTGKPSILNRIFLDTQTEVFISEGLIDAILLVQEGYPFISSDSSLNFYHVVQDRGQIFYILQDNDRAGLQEANKWIKTFGRGRVKLFNWSVIKEAREGDDPISIYQRHGKEVLGVFYDKKNYI